MKAKIILVNWGLSLCGLGCVDTERSAMWAVMAILGWFVASTLFLRYADRRGWMDKVVRRYKLDEK